MVGGEWGLLSVRGQRCGRDTMGAEAPRSRMVVTQSLRLPPSGPQPVSPGVSHEASTAGREVEEGRVQVDAMITRSKEEASRLHCFSKIRF